MEENRSSSSSLSSPVEAEWMASSWTLSLEEEASGSSKVTMSDGSQDDNNDRYASNDVGNSNAFSLAKTR